MRKNNTCCFCNTSRKRISIQTIGYATTKYISFQIPVFKDGLYRGSVYGATSSIFASRINTLRKWNSVTGDIEKLKKTCYSPEKCQQSQTIGKLPHLFRTRPEAGSHNFHVLEKLPTSNKTLGIDLPKLCFNISVDGMSNACYKKKLTSELRVQTAVA